MVLHLLLRRIPVAAASMMRGSVGLGAPHGSAKLPLSASYHAQVKAAHLLGILRIALRRRAAVLRTALLIVLLGRHCQVRDRTGVLTVKWTTRLTDVNQSSE